TAMTAGTREALMSFTRRLAGASADMSWGTRLSALIIILYGFAALFAPWIAPYGESEIVGPPVEPWSRTFLLGTDNLGLDMLTRLIYGIRNTIAISLVATLISFLVGVTLGLLSAISGGWVDAALSRVVDTLMAVPQLIFALLLLSV